MKNHDAKTKRQLIDELNRSVDHANELEKSYAKVQAQIEKLNINETEVSHSLLQTIFNQTHVLIAYLDSQFNFITVNQTYAKTDEHDPSFYPGKNHFDLFPNEENERIFKGMVSSGKPHFEYAKPFEYEYNPERAVTYWDWSLIPVKDKYGVVDGLILTLLNVTKRILTEVSLRESETKYKGLFNGIRDSILVANTDRKIINYNPAFSSLFGYSLNDIIGKPTLYIYENEEQFIELGNAIKKHVADLTPFFYTVNYKKKNGDVFPGETGIYYLKDTDGEVFGFIGLIRDITEKLRIEKALKDSEAKYRNINTELEKTNNMKELLLDIMSHDLRNPAGAISGLTEMAIEENPEDEILQLIKSASDSLLQVIEKATILSKVALDEEIEKEELDLSKLIRQVINEFKTFLNSNGMSVEYQPLEALTIKANSIIGEVFRNYISNAIKYAHIGNRIVIEQEIMDDVVTVYVKDFGKTIPIEEYDNIFERRVQLSKVEKRGQGLGLAIVKRIAEAHKGEVGVKQNEPNGNIFYLKIPKG